MAARPLRFGIMCRGTEFADWEALCITNLLAVEGVEPALLIVDDRPVQPPSRRERLRALFDPRTLVWRLYQRLVLNRRSQSTRPVDLSVELAGVPVRVAGRTNSASSSSASGRRRWMQSARTTSIS